MVTNHTDEVDMSSPEYLEARRRASQQPTYRLTWRAQHLAPRKARGQVSHAEAVELRAVAAVYAERRPLL